MRRLFKNIQELLQVRDTAVDKLSGAEMKELPSIENAWLYTEDDRIVDYGKMSEFDEMERDETIDATGKIMMPAWVDSHTHLVYAGNREQEFVDRIKGLTYAEIAAKGGGIPNSAKLLQKTSEEELYRQTAERLEEVMKYGTGALEIKSGYGLTTDAELKMLRVAKKLEDNYNITIKKTFLGAHALPPEYKDKREEYIDLVIDEMLPKVAEEELADYIDIFCEQGYFTIEDTERILEAGQKYGLQGKIHVNQFHNIDGISTAVKHNALSVDHLEVLSDRDVEVLKSSATMPVSLPSCSFYLGLPYTPARKLIDAGCPLALATDYNPGSTPSGNLNFVFSLACIKMNMTPEETINAMTINAAYALDINESHGSITKGKKANFILTDSIPSYGFLPYSFGNNHIDSVYIQGDKV